MYKKCIGCPNIGRDCIIRIISMPPGDVIEWCRAIKKQRGWSHQYLAEKSGVPKGTIDRIFAADLGTVDFKWTTIQRVVLGLLDCPAEEFDCEILLNQRRAAASSSYKSEEIERLKQDAHDLALELKYTKRELEAGYGQNKALKKVLHIACTACAVLCVALIGYLWLDARTEHGGLVRPQGVSPMVIVPILALAAAAAFGVAVIRHKIKTKKT